MLAFFYPSPLLRAELWKCVGVDGKVEYTNNSKYVESGVYKCTKEEMPPIQRMDAKDLKAGGRFIKQKRSSPERGTPVVKALRWVQAENPDVSKEEPPRCRISGEVHTVLPMQVRLSIFRAEAGVDHVLIPVADYHSTGCCFKRFEEELKGLCSTPVVTAKRVK